MWHSRVVLFRWISAADLSSPLPTVKKSVQKVNRRAESQTGQHPFPAISSGLCLRKQHKRKTASSRRQAHHRAHPAILVDWNGMELRAGAETLNHWRVPDVGRLFSWSGQY
jgi:hypothetical protein